MKVKTDLKNTFAVLLFLISCHSVAEKEKIFGAYYLHATDTLEDMALVYRVDDSFFKVIIEPTIFAFGHNEEYIIAKQHPRNWPAKPIKSITNYFIVPIYSESTHHPKKDILGPLNEQEFSEMLEMLHLSGRIKFSRTYKYLE